MHDDAGILQGDLIKEMNHEKVDTLKAYTKQLNGIKKGDSVSFLIKRTKAGFVVVTLTK